jgi:hypothetical protein
MAAATSPAQEPALEIASFVLDTSKLVQIFRAFSPQLSLVGTASAVLSFELPKNALVDGYAVTVIAGKADWAPAAKVGRSRLQSGVAVIDFGILRTVSGVALVGAAFKGATIGEVRPWIGVGFAKVALTAEASISSPDGAPLVTFSEVQTQRLEIQLTGNLTEESVAAALAVQLPDIPADFTIKINDGPPVWTSNGPAPELSSGEQSGPWSFSSKGFVQATVELGPALTKLAADPSAEPDVRVPISIAFSARVPGALRLDPPAEDQKKIVYLRRVSDVLPGGKLRIFEQEGEQSIPITLPSWATGVVGARAVLKGKLPEERTLPANGPSQVPSSSAPDAPPAAELVLDSDHALAVLLPKLEDPCASATAPELSQLTALRMPLRAGATGAELRVVLASAAASELGPGDPGEDLAGGASQPLTIPAGGAEVAPWVTVLFAKPVRLDHGQRLWARVLVSRGEVSSPASTASGVTRRGPPSGPWVPLPHVELVAPAGGTVSLADLGLSVRQRGRAAPDRPIEPVVLQFFGSAPASKGSGCVKVTPTSKGAAIDRRWQPVPLGGSTVELHLTSYASGEVTIDQLDLVLEAKGLTVT